VHIKHTLILPCLLFAALLLTVSSRAQSVTSVAVGAGAHHSLFINSDGNLWAMGQNSMGQLGDGSYNQTNLPEQIVAGGVTAAAAGAYHSLFLKNDGSLWVMGGNDFGQLGDRARATSTPTVPR